MKSLLLALLSVLTRNVDGRKILDDLTKGIGEMLISYLAASPLVNAGAERAEDAVDAVRDFLPDTSTPRGMILSSLLTMELEKLKEKNPAIAQFATLGPGAVKLLSNGISEEEWAMALGPIDALVESKGKALLEHIQSQADDILDTEPERG